MKIPYFHVDAFTNKTFAGNPAGVCPLDTWLPADTMQLIAAENRHAETAFFVPHPENPDCFQLRWFTPTAEVDLCGHATLATAFVLRDCLGYLAPKVCFETLSGPLAVEFQGDVLWLDFPSRPGQKFIPPPSLAEGLGLTPQEVYIARDILAVFEKQSEIATLTPDFTRLAELDVLGVIATAPGEETDFVSRFFAPRVGIPEDPVTGSSHCTLIPYWAKRLGKVKLAAAQLSARGGELACKLAGDRVSIGGRAVLYMKGEIVI
jgi:predicted PhzF superfamily epimerase YddE/YHI9